MRLSTFSDYSLRVLMYSAIKNKDLCTTKEIGEYFKVSYHHLVKVVHKLSSAGLIEVKQGRGGGFRLTKDPAQIGVGEVIRLVEPDFFLVECQNARTNKCAITRFCRLKGVIDQALEGFITNLNQTTIADLVRDNRDSW